MKNAFRLLRFYTRMAAIFFTPDSFLIRTARELGPWSVVYDGLKSSGLISQKRYKRLWDKTLSEMEGDAKSSPRKELQ
jgi:hypothetical protein